MTEYKETAPKLEPMPPAMLAEMFPSGIVVIPEEFQPAASPAPSQKIFEEAKPIINELNREPESKPEAAINWLGNFARKVLVVVNDQRFTSKRCRFCLIGKNYGCS
jgi:hypothetical protein